MTRNLALLPALAMLLAGCQEDSGPDLPPRPVMSVVVQAASDTETTFVGSIAARYETNLGFTIFGMLAERPVKLGERIEKGQLVAAIDTTVLESTMRQEEANLANARAQLETAEASRKRQVALLSSRASSQATLDSAQQSAVSARANVTQAEANLRKAQDQLDNARIYAEFPGVVTATGAEQGELVAAGQTVVTVARTDVREAVIDVREDSVSGLAIGDAFQIALQQSPSIQVSGQIREIAPQADAVTRTRRVRILLTDPPESFRLGATITAKSVQGRVGRIRIPASAILKVDGHSYVWLVEPEADGSAHAVTLHEVSPLPAMADATHVEIRSGLQQGQRVVTAGIHSLSDGQQVRLFWGKQS